MKKKLTIKQRKKLARIVKKYEVEKVGGYGFELLIGFIEDLLTNTYEKRNNKNPKRRNYRIKAGNHKIIRNNENTPPNNNYE